MPHYSPDTHEIMQMVLEDMEIHPESNLQMVTDRLEENITLLNPYFTKKGIFYGCIHALSDAELIEKEDTHRIREKDKWTTSTAGSEALNNHQTLIDLAQEPLKIKHTFFTHLKQSELEHLITLYLYFHGNSNNSDLIEFIELFMFGTHNCGQGRAQVGRGVTGARERGWISAPQNQPRTLAQQGSDYISTLESPYEFGPFKIHFNHDNPQYQVETFIPNVHQFEPINPPDPEDDSEEDSQCNLEADGTTPAHDDLTITNFHRHPDAINLG